MTTHRQRPDHMTCIHQSVGLCDDCQAEYDTDPQSWIVYGHHTAGESRWAAFEAEMRPCRMRMIRRYRIERCMREMLAKVALS